MIHADDFQEQLMAENTQLRQRIAELEEAAQRRRPAEWSLSQGDGLFRAFIEQSYDGILIVDHELRIVEWNKAQTDIFGLTREEMLGKTLWEYQWAILPDEQKSQRALPAIEARLKNSVRQDSSSWTNSHHTLEVQARDGCRKTVQVSTFPIAVQDEILYCAITRDTTTEQSAEHNYQMLFREMLDGFAQHEIILDDQGKPVNYRFLSINPAFERLTGLNAADLVGKTVLDVMPGTEQQWIENYGRVALTGEPAYFENFSSELQKLFEVTAFQPAPRQFACIFRDITGRRQAEQALRESEALYRSILHASPDDITIIDLNGCVRSVSPMAVKMFGYEREDQMVGRPVAEYLAPEDLERGLKNFQSLFEGIQPGPVEYRAVRADGSWFESEVNAEFIRDADGKPTSIVMIVRDITARKQAEEALRQSELFLRTILQTTTDGFWVVDTQGRIIDANQAFCEMTGYTYTELLQSSISDLDAIEEPADTAARIRRVIENGYELFETRHRRKDGSLVEVEVSVTYLEMDGGRFVSFCHDITQRKRTMQALSESQALYLAVVEGQTDPVSRWLPDTTLTLVNQAYCDYCGKSREELLGARFMNWLPQENQDVIQSAIDSLLKHEVSSISKEELNLDAQGNPRLVIWNYQPITDKEGKIVEFQSVGRDITERNKSEEARRESELRFREVLEHSQDAAYKRDLRRDSYEYLSPVMFQLSGYTQEEMRGMDLETTLGLFHPDDRPHMQHMLTQALASRAAAHEMEYRFRHKDGAYRRLLDRFTVIRDTQGEPSHLIGSVGDITARRQAEDALRDSQARLQMVTENMADLVCLHKPDTSYIWLSPSVREILGYEAEELIGRSPYDLFLPEDAEQSIRPSHQQVTQAFTQNTIEYRIIKKDGSLIWMQGIARPVLDADGKVSAIVSASRDITARVQAEQALQENEENFRTFFESVDDVILVADPEERIIYGNAALVDKLGYAPDELTGLYLLDLYPPDRRLEAETVHAAMFRGERRTSMLPLLTKTGALIPAETRLWFGLWSGKECIFSVSKDLSAEYEALQSFERLFRNNPAPMALSTDSERRVLDVNDAFLDTLGYTAEEVIGKTASEIHFFVDPQLQTPATEQFATSGNIKNIELQARRKDGTLLDGLFSGETITSHGEKRYLTVMMDITQRKQAEEKLRFSEKQFRNFFELGAVGMAITSLEKGWLECNDRLCEMLGYSRPELKDLTWAQLTHPEDLAQDIDSFNRTLAGEIDGFTMDKRYIRKDGSVLYANLAARGLRLPDVKMDQFAAIIQDISQRKRAEEDLRLQATALNSTVNAMVITDRDGSIQWINPAFTRLTGYTLEEVQGQTLRLLKSGAQPPEFYQQMWNTILAGETWKGEVVNKRKDRSLYPEEMTITPMRDPGGYINHFIGVKQDISERKQWQAALEQERAILERRVEERTVELSQANTSLLRAMRVKDEFLANMSHELRTPLTGILGLSEVLQSGIYGDINEKTLHALRNIQESGQHLLSLINDILDLSKAEAGKIELDLRPTSIANVVQASLRMVRQNAQKKQLILNTNLDSAVEIIMADERRLKQILVNLLSNAVKFTPEGGTVGVEVASSPDKKQVDFIVWDTGIGINPKDMDRLFKPFVQLDARLERQFGGTGLGLSLVDKLVELHGGSIRVESQPGHGSRFIASLPWRQPENFPGKTLISNQPPGAAPAHESSIRLKRELDANLRKPLCLIAEDNETTLGFLRDFLTSQGFITLEARNGAEALQRVHESRPDLILMDIQMPVIDGVTAIHLLRQDSNFETTPIIALTALAMAGDRERCLQAGASDYLSKPVDLDALEKILERLVSAAARK